ncbi:MAG: 3-oxoacyl-[acyl-carrier-protein] reductase [Firmicutes bacterium]|nr:3-oxoacyl-[acyl-carrier-protein] reductase [Bacillota bacterium]
MSSLKGKTVVVTGGNTGIGKEICLNFAMAGSNVVINYLYDEDLAYDLLAHVENMGGNGLIVKGDVSKLDQAQIIIDRAIEEFGCVDVLVNNSGITRDNLMMRMTENEFDSVINVNLKGTWNMCKSVTRHMLKNRSGKIVNIASVVGIMGNAGQANYVASKAAVIGLTKTLSKEFGSRGVTCNAVAPGFIQTKMTEELTEEVKNNYLKQIPLNRFGSSQDVANAVLFLASDKADYITGQVLSVNGGMI